MTPIIYAKPNCVHCAATKSLFNKLGVKYDTIDITKDKEALKFIKSKGFREAPVVQTENDMWSGFQRNKIESLSLQNEDDDPWDF